MEIYLWGTIAMLLDIEISKLQDYIFPICWS